MIEQTKIGIEENKMIDIVQKHGEDDEPVEKYQYDNQKNETIHTFMIIDDFQMTQALQKNTYFCTLLKSYRHFDNFFLINTSQEFVM